MAARARVNGAASEVQRLRSFKREAHRVEFADGNYVYVRQLSAADAVLISPEDPKAGLKSAALSLCTADGERLFGEDNLDDGLTIVGDWPEAYFSAVAPTLEEINGATLEDARRDSSSTRS